MNKLTDWINKGIDKDATKELETFAKSLASNDKNAQDRITLRAMTTSQLRKFFGEIKRIQAQGFSADTIDDVLMLKPRLAYAVGRDEGKTKLSAFYQLMSKAIDGIDFTDIEKGKKQFKNFINVLECIVAYHKEAESNQSR